jgi:hypothetical protein
MMEKRINNGCKELSNKQGMTESKKRRKDKRTMQNQMKSY